MLWGGLQACDCADRSEVQLRPTCYGTSSYHQINTQGCIQVLVLWGLGLLGESTTYSDSNGLQQGYSFANTTATLVIYCLQDWSIHEQLPEPCHLCSKPGDPVWMHMRDAFTPDAFATVAEAYNKSSDTSVKDLLHVAIIAQLPRLFDQPVWPEEDQPQPRKVALQVDWVSRDEMMLDGVFVSLEDIYLTGLEAVRIGVLHMKHADFCDSCYSGNSSGNVRLDPIDPTVRLFARHIRLDRILDVTGDVVHIRCTMEGSLRAVNSRFALGGLVCGSPFDPCSTYMNESIMNHLQLNR